VKRSVFICLIVILLLGAWLRLDRLGEVPPSLYGDEASVGYDAWSIAVHGKDQWGNTMPIAFKSFGEYKNPIHIYATSLAIKRLGYTDFVVRLPSAITGIANLLLLFILARLILRNEWVALTSAGLLSISPWHIQFSRIAWETNFALGIFLLAMIAFFYGIRGRSWLIVVALALFGIDLYTYNAAKVFVPLFLLLIGTIYHDILFEQFRFVFNRSNCILGGYDLYC
jgi:4-amino-4-deoxy-L-arabinose transferase-like glycosyltransferase